MLKSGNGTKAQCVNNLMQLTRGDVHLDQLRGFRADLIDMPATTAAPFMAASARWVIENYEPRVAFDGFNLTTGDTEGNFKTQTSIE